MSDLSLNSIKEQILYDNLDIIDINQLEDEIKHVHNTFNIYSDKKINSIKMNKNSSKYPSFISSKSSQDTIIESKEQIDEVKYNVIFILQNGCGFDQNMYDDIIKDRYIMTKRLVEIEMTPDLTNYCQKKYVFIPEEKEPCFELENKKILTIKNGKMFIEKEPLKTQKEFESDALKNKEKKTDGDSINSFSHETISGNINSISINSSLSSKKSKKDSSENETKKGDLINYYKEGNKYFKFLYVKEFEKEVDGIYTFHKEIKLIKGKIKLSKEYILNENNYNVKNDLKAFIICKNFEANSIPKNEPVIVEVKKSFELLGVLKQIKKISKIAKNLTSAKNQLPKFVIGIMCSFKKEAVEKQFEMLNVKKGEGDSTLFEHINKIIEDNGIKYVLAAIKEEKIEDYDLGNEDYTSDYTLKRVDIQLINQKLKFGFTSDQLEEIKKVIKYESINHEKIIEISYNEYEKKSKELDEKDKENKELHEQLDEKNKENKELHEKSKELDEKNKENKELHEKNKELHEKLDEKSKELDEKNKENKELHEKSKELDEKNKENKELHEKNKEYEETIKKLKEKVDALAKENKELKNKA